MSTVKVISVRYVADDYKKVEQVALLAGYSSLSTYIRERSLGRSRYDDARKNAGGWANQQAMEARL